MDAACHDIAMAITRIILLLLQLYSSRALYRYYLKFSYSIFEARYLSTRIFEAASFRFLFGEWMQNSNMSTVVSLPLSAVVRFKRWFDSIWRDNRRAQSVSVRPAQHGEDLESKSLDTLVCATVLQATTSCQKHFRKISNSVGPMRTVIPRHRSVEDDVKLTIPPGGAQLFS